METAIQATAFEILVKYTEKIPEGNVFLVKGQEWNTLKTVSGWAVSKGLIKDTVFFDADVAHTKTISVPCEFEEHTHKGLEIIDLLSGQLTLIVDGVEIEMSRTKPVVVPPNTPHSAMSYTGCSFIATIKPSDKSFPDVWTP